MGMFYDMDAYAVGGKLTTATTNGKCGGIIQKRNGKE